jgi:hypothetical protein
LFKAEFAMRDKKGPALLGNGLTVKLAPVLICAVFGSCQKPAAKFHFIWYGPALRVGDQVSYEAEGLLSGEKETGFTVHIKADGAWHGTGSTVHTNKRWEKIDEKWYREAGFETRILRLDLVPTLNGTQAKIKAITVETTD